MPKPTESELHEEFTNAYERISLSYNRTYWFSKAFVKIAQFLYADESSPFWEALLVLERRMQDELQRRTGSSFSPSQLRNVSFAHGRDNKWKATLEKDPTKSLMTSVLTQFELEEGFKEAYTDGDGHPRSTRFLGQLSSDDFAHHIKTAHLAKDYVGLEHGEYSHRIQWFCIGQAKDHLGLTDSRDSRDKIATLFMKSGPFWGMTFDRTIDADPCDFRKPERLNNWFVEKARGGGENFPLIHGFLKSRRERMGSSGYTSFVLKMMVAKNIFPEKFSTLTDEQLGKYKNFRANPKDAQFLYNICLGATEKQQVEDIYKNKVLKGDWSKYVKQV
ncbi:hypothetical protein F0U62_21935 [Cystobacter fuscus]|uniref:LirA/MavJ family T4SS effector n=1 Tax=Cystobacter fuscus TaxID=43 RepID=UPI002B302B36|nr:hypothetical protein F0U62_21935 [Cystobacter fuscus]